MKVIPDAHFGLIHGKAGVITLADGRQTAFLGSVNESLTAWRLNYELLWEDDDPDAVAWVQEEFDALWHSPFAVDLAEAVVQDIGRLAAAQRDPGPDGLARATRTRRPRSSRPRSTARRSGSGSTRSTSSSSPSTPTWAPRARASSWPTRWVWARPSSSPWPPSSWPWLARGRS